MYDGTSAVDSDSQLALRQNATQLSHEHFHGGILEVQARKAKEHHVSCLTLADGDSRNGRLSSSTLHDTGVLDGYSMW